LVADSGYGDCTLFRLGLTERGLSYVVEVDPSAVAQPAEAMPVALGYTGRGRPPKPADPIRRSASNSSCCVPGGQQPDR